MPHCGHSGQRGVLCATLAHLRGLEVRRLTLVIPERVLGAGAGAASRGTRSSPAIAAVVVGEADARHVAALWAPAPTASPNGRISGHLTGEMWRTTAEDLREVVTADHRATWATWPFLRRRRPRAVGRRAQAETSAITPTTTPTCRRPPYGFSAPTGPEAEGHDGHRDRDQPDRDHGGGLRPDRRHRRGGGQAERADRDRSEFGPCRRGDADRDHARRHVAAYRGGQVHVHAVGANPPTR